MNFRSLGQARRAMWGVVDHGLFSVTNFSLSIVLARWLSPTEYGSFAIAFSAFILISTLQIGTIIEPMLIFGPGRYQSVFARYVDTVSRVHFAVTSVTSVALLGIAACLTWLGNRSVAASFVGLAAATPFVLFVAVRRRVFYVDGRVHFAALVSAVLLICSLTGVYALLRLNALSPLSGFLAIGIAGVLASCVSLLIRGAQEKASADAGPAFAAILKEHWQYARWGTPAIAMSWALINAFIIGVPLMTGIAAAAGLRAMLNLVQPPIQLLNALGTVVLPSLVRANGSPRFRTLARFSLCAFVAAALVYIIPLLLFAKPFSVLLYHSRYLDVTNLVTILSPVPVFCAVITACVVVLQARERPQLLFVSWSVGALTAAIVGAPLIILAGVQGAATAITAAYGAAAVAFCISAVKQLHRKNGESHADSPDRQRKKREPILELEIDARAPVS